MPLPGAPNPWTTGERAASARNGAHRLPPHCRSHLGPEELDGPQYILTRNGTHGELDQVAILPEDLVLVEDLLHDLLGVAQDQGAMKPRLGFQLPCGHGRPPSFPPDSVHGRQEGRHRHGSGVSGLFGDEAVGVDADPEILLGVSGPGAGLSLQVDHGREAYRCAPDDGEGHG